MMTKFKLLVLLMLAEVVLLKDTMTNKREITEAKQREGKGPPRRKKAMEVVVGRVGQEVKLVCPITGNPTPIIEWEKVGDLYNKGLKKI